MKTKIYASIEAIARKYDIPKENIIEVVVSLDEVGAIEGSVDSSRPEAKSRGKLVQPFESNDGTTNEEALANYKDFISDVSCALDYHRCDVLKEQPSISTESQYFYFYGTDKDGNRKERWLIVLRIADHDKEEGLAGLTKKEKTEKRKQIREFREGRIAKITGEPVPIYRLRQVVIGDKGFSNYDDALDDIYRILNEASPNT